ncbi:hypothetical protein PCE1_004582 [Barthelona sp. PCE]
MDTFLTICDSLSVKTKLLNELAAFIKEHPVDFEFDVQWNLKRKIAFITVLRLTKQYERLLQLFNKTVCPHTARATLKCFYFPKVFAWFVNRDDLISILLNCKLSLRNRVITRLSRSKGRFTKQCDLIYTTEGFVPQEQEKILPGCSAELIWKVLNDGFNNSAYQLKSVFSEQPRLLEGTFDFLWNRIIKVENSRFLMEIPQILIRYIMRTPAIIDMFIAEYTKKGVIFQGLVDYILWTFYGNLKFNIACLDHLKYMVYNRYVLRDPQAVVDYLVEQVVVHKKKLVLTQTFYDFFVSIDATAIDKMIEGENFSLDNSFFCLDNYYTRGRYVPGSFIIRMFQKRMDADLDRLCDFKKTMYDNVVQLRKVNYKISSHNSLCKEMYVDFCTRYFTRLFASDVTEGELGGDPSRLCQYLLEFYPYTRTDEMEKVEINLLGRKIMVDPILALVMKRDYPLMMEETNNVRNIYLICILLHYVHFGGDNVLKVINYIISIINQRYDSTVHTPCYNDQWRSAKEFVLTREEVLKGERNFEVFELLFKFSQISKNMFLLPPFGLLYKVINKTIRGEYEDFSIDECVQYVKRIVTLKLRAEMLFNIYPSLYDTIVYNKEFQEEYSYSFRDLERYNRVKTRGEFHSLKTTQKAYDGICDTEPTINIEGWAEFWHKLLADADFVSVVNPLQNMFVRFVTNLDGCMVKDYKNKRYVHRNLAMIDALGLEFIFEKAQQTLPFLRRLMAFNELNVFNEEKKHRPLPTLAKPRERIFKRRTNLAEIFLSQKLHPTITISSISNYILYMKANPLRMARYLEVDGLSKELKTQFFEKLPEIVKWQKMSDEHVEALRLLVECNKTLNKVDEEGNPTEDATTDEDLGKLQDEKQNKYYRLSLKESELSTFWYDCIRPLGYLQRVCTVHFTDEERKAIADCIRIDNDFPEELNRVVSSIISLIGRNADIELLIPLLMDNKTAPLARPFLDGYAYSCSDGDRTALANQLIDTVRNDGDNLGITATKMIVGIIGLLSKLTRTIDVSEFIHELWNRRVGIDIRLLLVNFCSERIMDVVTVSGWSNEIFKGRFWRVLGAACRGFPFSSKIVDSIINTVGKIDACTDKKTYGEIYSVIAHHWFLPILSFKETSTKKPSRNQVLYSLYQTFNGQCRNSSITIHEEVFEWIANNLKTVVECAPNLFSTMFYACYLHYDDDQIMFDMLCPLIDAVNNYHEDMMSYIMKYPLLSKEERNEFIHPKTPKCMSFAELLACNTTPVDFALAAEGEPAAVMDVKKFYSFGVKLAIFLRVHVPEGYNTDIYSLINMIAYKHSNMTDVVKEVYAVCTDHFPEFIVSIDHFSSIIPYKVQITEDDYMAAFDFVSAIEDEQDRARYVGGVLSLLRYGRINNERFESTKILQNMYKTMPEGFRFFLTVPVDKSLKNFNHLRGRIVAGVKKGQFPAKRAKITVCLPSTKLFKF